MKKRLMFALMILVVLSFVIGCSEDTPLENMIFVDHINKPTKEFIIYENLTFKVTFVNDSEFLQEFPFMEIGDWVTGIVKGTTSKWKDDIIEGKAEEMTSNNEDLATILEGLGSFDFKLAYLYDSNNIVDGINVEFPGEGELDKISNTLMGGMYLRK